MQDLLVAEQEPMNHVAKKWLKMRKQEQEFRRTTFFLVANQIYKKM
jgi:hypothetical protein